MTESPSEDDVKLHFLDTSRIVQEWRNLPAEKLSTRKKAKLFPTALKYPEKNRYIDVLPFETTRVALAPTEKNEDGYINASFIQLPQSRTIATQGPLPQCFEDFWQMVWENKIRIIIMLTRLLERQRVKAHCYWPADGKSEIFSLGITVEGTSTEIEEHFTVRKFLVSCGERKRSLYQIQYTDWPDFGVPSSSHSILKLLERIDSLMEKLKLKSTKRRTHFLCHCSAGIGRCGTLLVIRAILEQIKDGVPISQLSPEETVKALRKERIGIVQTQEQYAFIYQVVNDFIAAQNSPRARNLRQISAPSVNSLHRRKRPLRSARIPKNATVKKAHSETWKVTNQTIVQ